MPVDVDECGVGNGGCDQICTNSEGSFACSCHPGYIWNANGEHCAGEIWTGAWVLFCLFSMRVYIFILSQSIPLDVDECGVENGGCDQICTNSDGGFACSCDVGFVLENGVDCSGE